VTPGSRVPGERSETRDPAQKAQGATQPTWITFCGPLGPGSRARTSTECKTPRRGARLAGTRGWCVTAHSFARTAGPGALPHNSYSQCQTAQSSSFPPRVAAPGFCLSLFHPPHEGRAERRKAHYFRCRAIGRDDPRLVEARRASSGTRSPLGAPPWRFWVGGRASFSGISSGSVQRAPRSQVVVPGGRGPGPPGALVTSRGRRTPLPAPPSARLRKTAPQMSEDRRTLLYAR
jgi:hypothetical protein